ncbi:MAG: helix-turn-helix transcriptional regulator [Pseudomonadota bacterium]
MDVADLSRIAERALRGSRMDSVGLYLLGEDGAFDCGVILGMPDAFVRAYETTGVPIDPVLARVRETGAPSSTLTALGERWRTCQLYQRVSGRFGLHGFATLPLYEGERMSGVLYLGAMSAETAARLDAEGMCALTVGATQVSTMVMATPRRRPGLTQRQNDVARLASEGLCNRAIAEALDTGEAAVRKHLKALNRIFETGNRTAMAAAWRRAQG